MKLKVDNGWDTVKENFLALLSSTGELLISNANPNDKTPVCFKFDRTVSRKYPDRCSGRVKSPLCIPVKAGENWWRLVLLKHNSRLLNGERLLGVSGRNRCEIDVSFTYVDNEGKKYACIGFGVHKDRHNSRCRLHSFLTKGCYSPKQKGPLQIPDSKVLEALRANVDIDADVEIPSLVVEKKPKKPRKKIRKKIEKKAKPAVKRKKAKNTIGKGKKRKKRKFDDADVALGLLMFTQGK